MNLSALQGSPADDARCHCRAERPVLMVLAAARWDFDWQRPQQLLTRLAKHYRVFYIEAPRTTHRDPWLACTPVAPGVEVLVAHTRCEAPGFADAQIPTMAALLARLMGERGIVAPLAWLDTPAPRPLLEALAPCAVIFDCQDDPAAADSRLRRHAAALLREADLVLAAGPSLLAALRDRRGDARCIGAAVDAAHFAPPAPGGDAIEAVSARAIHAAIPQPRLGFSGVIDERIDLDLLARVAELRPDWQIVMAGPLRGVAAEALPRRANLLWLGAQTHAILPHLQAHWDVGLLPLRVDACATRATPIEALALLAGARPVVATPVADVVALYGHVVRVADGAAAFVDACRAAMCERGPLRRRRAADALIAARSHGWDRAAERVHRLLAEITPAPASPAATLPVQLLAGRGDAPAACRPAAR